MRKCLPFLAVYCSIFYAVEIILGFCPSAVLIHVKNVERIICRNYEAQLVKHQA